MADNDTQGLKLWHELMVAFIVGGIFGLLGYYITGRIKDKVEDIVR